MWRPARTFEPQRASDSQLWSAAKALGVCRIRTRLSEGRRPGSIPGEGTVVRIDPRECVGHTAVFEAARPGSIPGRGTRDMIMSSGCAGFAHDFAKVEDQVRFLARTFTLLDAGARRPGDRLQPGSSGFDSHRRLCTRELTSTIGSIKAGVLFRLPSQPAVNVR